MVDPAAASVMAGVFAELEENLAVLRALRDSHPAEFARVTADMPADCLAEINADKAGALE